MKKTTMATFVLAAGFAPRPVAPTPDLFQGSGVPVGVGFGWRLRGNGRAISTEHDSAPGASPV